MNNFFNKLAMNISHAMGTLWAFLFVIVLLSVLAVSGSHLGSYNVLEIINIGVLVVVFLLAFLTLYSHNRHYQDLNSRFDEMNQAIRDIRTHLESLETDPEEYLDKLLKEVKDLNEELSEDDDIDLKVNDTDEDR
jgi:low affinity Fe/Cu permease